jgi:hypothetical protein
MIRTMQSDRGCVAFGNEELRNLDKSTRYLILLGSLNQCG